MSGKRTEEDGGESSQDVDPENKPEEEQGRRGEQRETPNRSVSQERNAARDVRPGGAERRSVPQGSDGAGGVRPSETFPLRVGPGTYENIMTRQYIDDRICLVCQMLSFPPPNTEWLKPCRCGYWVHDQCLIDVVLHYENYNPGTNSIGCRNCLRAYNILPNKNMFIAFGERFSSVWYQNLCHLSMKGLLMLMADFAFIKIGSSTLKQIYGLEEAGRMIYSMTPKRAGLFCQVIPVALIIVSTIAWEDTLLRKLRRCSKLPLVGRVFPMEDPDIPDLSVKGSFYMDMIGGLLLPWYAKYTAVLYVGLVESPLHRFLLGGATFLLLKGILNMYYKQKLYARFCKLSVVNFITPNG